MSKQALRELVKDLRESKAEGQALVVGAVLKAMQHIADRIEAALAASSPTEDLGLVGASNIPWTSVEGAPAGAALESDPIGEYISNGGEIAPDKHGNATTKSVPVSEDVRKLAFRIQQYGVPTGLSDGEIAQLIADALREEQRRTLEWFAQDHFRCKNCGRCVCRHDDKSLKDLSPTLAEYQQHIRALAAREGGAHVSCG